METETKHTLSFTITQKREKYFGINLTKYTLCAENYKKLMKEIKED